MMTKWIPGRQNTEGVVGYQKLKLLCYKNMDCWLIRYHPGFSLPAHKDPVSGKKHFRLNIQLSGDGEFKCERVIWSAFNRIFFFRPDLYLHSVESSTKQRLVFSLGIAL